jgi:hypothetical protein
MSVEVMGRAGSVATAPAVRRLMETGRCVKASLYAKKVYRDGMICLQCHTTAWIRLRSLRRCKGP